MLCEPDAHYNMYVELFQCKKNDNDCKLMYIKCKNGLNGKIDTISHCINRQVKWRM